MTFETEQQIQCMTDYMFVPDSVGRSDATIVLGMTLWQRPLEKALELFDLNLSGTLIFSGGPNSKLARAESLHMYEHWLALSKPAENVLVDQRSSNTRENMIHSKTLLEAQGFQTDSMHINVIAINYHMRRAVETFRAVFGNRVSVGVVNYQSIYCHPESWFQNSQGTKLICTEARKIKQYLPDANLPDQVQAFLSRESSV